MAASLVNQYAGAESIPVVATAAATDAPYDAVPEPVAELLSGEGIDVRTFRPRGVSSEDLSEATRVIAIGCDLTGVDLNGAAIERWDDVPKPSEDLDGAARAIRRHVEELFDAMKRESS